MRGPAGLLFVLEDAEQRRLIVVDQQPRRALLVPPLPTLLLHPPGLGEGGARGRRGWSNGVHELVITFP